MSEDTLPEHGPIPVIARSEATRQSSLASKNELDCFVASAPRHDEALRHVAADLNFASGAAERVARATTLVTDNNARIADAALKMPFDSSPYSFAFYLAAADAR